MLFHFHLHVWNITHWLFLSLTKLWLRTLSRLPLLTRTANTAAVCSNKENIGEGGVCLHLYCFRASYELGSHALLCFDDVISVLGIPVTQWSIFTRVIHCLSDKHVITPIQTKEPRQIQVKCTSTTPQLRQKKPRQTLRNSAKFLFPYQPLKLRKVYAIWMAQWKNCCDSIW